MTIERKGNSIPPPITVTVEDLRRELWKRTAAAKNAAATGPFSTPSAPIVVRQRPVQRQKTGASFPSFGRGVVLAVKPEEPSMDYRWKKLLAGIALEHF